MPARPFLAILERAAASFCDPARREDCFALHADAAVLHRSPPLDPRLDAEGRFCRACGAAFPDIRPELGAPVESGPLLACAFSVRGTHRGAFLGLAPTGRPMVAAGASLLSFERGRSVERRSRTDRLGLTRQFGTDLVASAGPALPDT